jgi:hypothetical protein
MGITLQQARSMPKASEPTSIGEQQCGIVDWDNCRTGPHGMVLRFEELDEGFAHIGATPLCRIHPNL